MAVQTFSKSMGLEDYLKTWHTNQNNPTWGGGGFNESGLPVTGYQGKASYFDPNGMTVDQWIASIGGAGNIEQALADNVGVNSGRFGTAEQSAQWAPKYDAATGQVTRQLQDGGDEYGGLAMGAATGLLGGMGAFGNPFGDLFGGAGADASWGVNAQGGGLAEELASLTGSGGAGGAGVGGFGGFGGAGVGSGGLSDILGWVKDNPGIVKLGGTALQTLLGVLGNDKKADALKELSAGINQGRQPFLGSATNWLNDPASYFAGPGKSAMDANLKALSATYGNPIDSPTALGIANEAALKNWQNAVLGFGNVGLGGQGIQANIGTQAINASGDSYGDLAFGVDQIFNPKQNTLEQLLKTLAAGGKLGYGGV